MKRAAVYTCVLCVTRGKPFVVVESNYDAARPYAVVATFRRFNRVIARYADEAQAKRRARDKNRRMRNEPALRRP